MKALSSLASMPRGNRLKYGNGPDAFGWDSQCRGWGTGWMKLAQQAQRQRLRQGGAWAVERRPLKTQDRTFRLEQDLDPGWG
jgi:hypothetical protein